MRIGTRGSFLLAGVVALWVAMTACSPLHDRHHPELIAMGTGGAGDEVPGQRAFQPYVFPWRSLCSKGGAVTIMEVTPIRPSGGITVVDWGVRKRYPGDPYTIDDNGGGVPGKVSQFRGFSESTPVDAPCGSSTVFDELDVSVETPTSRGGMEGVWVTTSSGQRVRAQFALAICTTKTCAPVVGDLSVK